jgi:hypothetical protein
MATGKPTRKRPPRGLFATRPALLRATNEQLLQVFGDIGAEIVRRNRNYGRVANTPEAILDGIGFAARAHKIQSDFTHGHFPYSIYHARETLAQMLGGPWVEDDDDFGLDDEEEGDDDA